MTAFIGGRRWCAGGWTFALVLTLLSVGCGGSHAAEDAEEAGEAQETQVAAAVDEPSEAADTVGEEPVRRYLPDAMRRSTRAENFPHFAHEELSCRVCHDAPRGHTVHTSLRCAECHPASARATRTSLAPSECLACHHSRERNIACSRCHTPPGPRTTTRSIRLGVWSAPRTRTLPFDHARHASAVCNTCHQERPTMAADRPCGSCHQDHHRPDARCQSCHTQPPASAHGVEAHVSCSGSGCHDAPDVDAMAQTRAVCLVCHQAQENHEVGRECADCHQVRPGEFAMAAVWESRTHTYGRQEAVR